MGQPEEAVHFLEYGVLGLLLYRALSFRVLDATVFVAAALVGVIVGTVDEIIQWIVPGRYFDFRDIALNGGASVLVQIVDLADGPAVRASGPFVVVTSPAPPCRGLGPAAGPVHQRDPEPGLPRRPFSAASERNRRAPSATMAISTVSTTRRGSGRGSHSRISRRTIETRAGRSRRFSTPRGVPTRNSCSLTLRRKIPSPTRRGFTSSLANEISPRPSESAEATPAAHRELMTAAFRENLILESFFTATISRSTFAWEPAQTSSNRGGAGSPLRLRAGSART